MPMTTSQIWKSADFTKRQKTRYFENKAIFFLQIKTFINCALRATLWQKIVLLRSEPLRLRTRLSVNATILKTLTSPVRSRINFIHLFALLFLLYKIHIYFIDQALQLKF